MRRVTQQVRSGYTHEATGRIGTVRGVSSRRTEWTRQGLRIRCKIVGDAVPKEYIPGVEKGIESVFPWAWSRASRGRRQGRADRRQVSRRQLYGAGVRDRGARCLREALQSGKSVLLEPIMKVEVVSRGLPTPSFGFELRRGRSGAGYRSNTGTSHAMVPLMNMFGYASPAAEQHGGRATFTMQFDHYAPAPPNTTEWDAAISGRRSECVLKSGSDAAEWRPAWLLPHRKFIEERRTIDEARDIDRLIAG